MVNLDCLPSDFLLACFSPSDIISEIEADFGLRSAVRDPFQGIFDLTAGDPFGLSVGDSEGNLNGALFEDDQDDRVSTTPRMKTRLPNLYPYKCGDRFESNWYRLFLSPKIRNRTYVLLSRDQYGEYCCLFRVLLKKVDDLVTRSGWYPCQAVGQAPA